MIYFSKIRVMIVSLFFVGCPAFVQAALVDCVGGCGKEDVTKIIINAANMILGVIGSVTLLFFVYGGLTLIMSGGASDRVTKGKTILTNSVIGLIIVFCASLVVKFTKDAL